MTMSIEAPQPIEEQFEKVLDILLFTMSYYYPLSRYERKDLGLCTLSSALAESNTV